MFVIYAALSVLEDSGYMARVAFLGDRLMRRIGLDGRVILPLIIGFGCNVPSLAAARDAMVGAATPCHRAHHAIHLVRCAPDDLPDDWQDLFRRARGNRGVRDVPALAFYDRGGSMDT